MTPAPVPPSLPTPATTSEIALLRLRQSPYYYLRSLTCDFDRGILTLRGTVPHQHLRAAAERIIDRIDGVHTIDNQVEVHDPALWKRSA